MNPRLLVETHGRSRHLDFRPSRERRHAPIGAQDGASDATGARALTRLTGAPRSDRGAVLGAVDGAVHGTVRIGRLGRLALVPNLPRAAVDDAYSEA